MRSFLISLLILTTIIVLIFLNTAAVDTNVSKLMLLCRNTANGSVTDAADQLLAQWKRCHLFFSLTSHYRDIAEADTALLAALSAADPVTRDANLTLFAAALRRIADSQRFNLFNIL